MEAIIYARFSKADQVRGHSIDRQLDNASAVCAFRELVPIRTEVEKGKSAFSGANRAKGSLLAKLENEIANGLHAGRVLVVEHLDRISRQGHDEVTDFLRACSQGGVSVATYDGMRLYPAGERVEMTAVIEVILKAELSREESEKKSVRIKKSFAAKREGALLDGKKSIASRPPSWIRKLPQGGFELIPERVEIVREAHRLCQSGYGTTMIAKTFNERGYPTWRNGTKPGTGWHESYIMRMLQMRTAIGEFVSPRYGHRIANYYPEAVEPVVFARTQAAMDTRRSKGGRRGIAQANIVSGIARCAVCGGRVVMRTARREGEIVKRVYKSGNKGATRVLTGASYLDCDWAYRRVSNEAGERLCTNRKTIRYEHLERAILDELMTVALSNEPTMQASDTRVKLADVEHRLAHAREQAVNLAENLKGRVLPTLVTMLAGVEDEIAALGAEQVSLAKELSREGGVQPSSAFLARIKQVRGDMTSPDLEVRREARTLVHDALRHIITDMLIEPTGSTLVILAEGLRAFRVDGKGVVDWRHDSTDDPQALRAITTEAYAGNKERVGAILNRLAAAA